MINDNRFNVSKKDYFYQYLLTHTMRHGVSQKNKNIDISQQKAMQILFMNLLFWLNYHCLTSFSINRGI